MLLPHTSNGTKYDLLFLTIAQVKHFFASFSTNNIEILSEKKCNNINIHPIPPFGQKMNRVLVVSSRVIPIIAVGTITLCISILWRGAVRRT